MLEIIHISTNTVVSSHAFLADADRALSMIETTPPSHEVVGTPEVEVVADVSEQ
jgi:hypothetical protein